MTMLLILFIPLFHLTLGVHGQDFGIRVSEPARMFQMLYKERLRSLMGTIKDSVVAARGKAYPSPSSSFTPAVSTSNVNRVFKVTDYGADPTGNKDSADAILEAISDAFLASTDQVLMPGISNLGGAEVYLEGGTYNISRPLRFPSSGGGNVLIHGGSLLASNDFPKDRHIIELWPSSSSKFHVNAENSSSNTRPLINVPASSFYEFITLKDLLLDCNFRGGAISVIDSLRTTIDTCYITHFTTEGILVQGGHETMIRNCFIGQHITAGGDPNEKNFSGTGISLVGNDNFVTDVVIFSAGTGILIAGQANILSGVHCYNKATGLGGVGIYVKLPGLTQTRIVNCYLDFTGIVAEDPVQLHISGSFFLGDAFILIKSRNGIVRGLNIVDNMFSGSGSGVNIVQLDESVQPFKDVSQVVVERNSVDGMKLRSTIGRRWVDGSGTLWVVDFSDVLLFRNMITHVQYAFRLSYALFTSHGVTSVTGNVVQVGTSSPVSATVYVSVDQNR